MSFEGNQKCRKEINSSERGFLLVSLLITTFIIVAIGLVTSQLVIANYSVASSQFSRTNAQFAADAGVDYAIDKINENGSWSGTSGEVTVMTENDTKTTFTASVGDGEDEFHKILTVTGRTYQPADSSTPETERSFEVVLLGIGGVSFGDASVVTGVGGLTMLGNSEILGGQVYVNGRISMRGNSQIGQTDEPVEVKVAHQSCPVPPDETYPRVCDSGDTNQPEPIDIRNNAEIYGEVQATNQTDGSSMSNPGLVAGSPSPVALPSYDRQAQQGAVVETMSASEAEQCNSNDVTVWPANLKIVGDVEVPSSGCDEVVVEGDVWIDGDLEIDGNSEIYVKDNLTEAPVVMVDGAGGIRLNSNTEMLENNNDIGFRFITYWSEAGCSPDCEDGVTGSALRNSQDQTTIYIESNVEARYVQFNALWSQVEIESNGEIGALSGQTVKLNSNATITFEVSVSETDGGAAVTAWVAESYKRVYN